MQESKTKALDEGNCAAARPGRKEAGVKTASPRAETCCEAGGMDELAPHKRSPGFIAAGKARGCARKAHSLTRGDLSGTRCGWGAERRRGKPRRSTDRSQQRS